MKKLKILLLLGIPLICAWTSVEDTYTLSAGYTVTIQGTSNLHNWSETVGTASGEGIVSLNSDASFDLDAMNIIMEVHSIKSKEGSIMNNNTYKALKADADPEITLKLNTPIKSIQTKSNTTAISAKANLTIAGVTKAIDILVKVSMPEQGKLAFEGSQTIKMTDYGIDPPTALFGTLKTGNEITINFKTIFSQKSK
jgi:polyisoprenoid-binding protein YceI